MRGSIFKLYEHKAYISVCLSVFLWCSGGALPLEASDLCETNYRLCVPLRALGSWLVHRCGQSSRVRGGHLLEIALLFDWLWARLFARITCCSCMLT